MTVAFALSGGGNLGPMQAGTVLALMEGGIEPDLLVGTSVGALNAAFLSSRPGTDGAKALVEAWSVLRRSEAIHLSAVTVLAGFVGLNDHLISDQQLRRLIRHWIEFDRIEQGSVPLAVTATDALSGECVVFTHGDAEAALAASSAIPGLFPPVQIDGHWFVDGSLSANQPVLQAQALGADDIYVITTATAPRQRPPRGAVALAMNSVSLVTSRVSRNELAEASRRAADRGGRVMVVPSSAPPAPGPLDFRRSASLAGAAYQRARHWLAEEAPVGSGSGSLRPGDEYSSIDRLPADQRDTADR